MQIPQERRKFRKQTLVVVSDNMQAKLYKGDENTFKHIGTVKQDYYPYEDAGRNMRVRTAESRQDTTNSYSTEQSENIKDSARKHLYTNLNKELMHRLQNSEFEQLIVTAPEEDVNKVQEALHKDLQKRLEVVIPKTLTKTNEMALLKHIEEALFPTK